MRLADKPRRYPHNLEVSEGLGPDDLELPSIECLGVKPSPAVHLSLID